ncbi:MAG: hypothetical protein ABJA98_35110 [Acidobacteriota bacterium]
MRTTRALNFVILPGVVSLFADMTYEGARSAIGPFLGMLGASAFAIGVVSGGGELVGYALRLWSGRLADRIHRYWAITFAGYALNLLAVPLLAFPGNWQIAAAPVILHLAAREAPFQQGWRRHRRDDDHDLQLGVRHPGGSGESVDQTTVLFGPRLGRDIGLRLARSINLNLAR